MEVFGVDDAAVDGDMRRMAKTVNFGIIYGSQSLWSGAASAYQQ